jgi:hypothetical protein
MGKKFVDHGKYIELILTGICLRDKLYATLEKNINQIAAIEKSIKTGVI